MKTREDVLRAVKFYLETANEAYTRGQKDFNESVEKYGFTYALKWHVEALVGKESHFKAMVEAVSHLDKFFSGEWDLDALNEAVAAQREYSTSTLLSESQKGDLYPDVAMAKARLRVFGKEFLNHILKSLSEGA